jgi:hypothetical protein
MNHEAAIVVLLALIAFIPVLRNRNARTLRVFAVFAWASLVSALVAFGFMIAMWSVIEERFKAAGWKVRWGPLVGVDETFPFFVVVGLVLLTMIPRLAAMDILCFCSVTHHRGGEHLEGYTVPFLPRGAAALAI